MTGKGRVFVPVVPGADQAIRALGRSHAIHSLPFACPVGADVLSYYLGYAEGQAARGCCGDQAGGEP